MTTYGYISEDFHSKDLLVEEINKYAAKNKIEIDELVDDPESNRIHWEKRQIKNIINNAKAGDAIVVFEASNLARSSAQVLEIMELLTIHDIALHLIKYDAHFSAKPTTNTRKFVKMIQDIESDFVAKRTTEALSRRRDEGLPLGRPKGRTNKELKLDKDRKEIQKYLDLGISKASIAKLIRCHAQTLYNYIEKRKLKGRSEV